MKKIAILTLLAIGIATKMTAQDAETPAYKSQISLGFGIAKDTGYQSVRAKVDANWEFVYGPLYGKVTAQSPIGDLASKYERYSILSAGYGRAKKSYSWGIGPAAVLTQPFDSGKHNFFFGGSLYASAYDENNYQSSLSVTYAKRRRADNYDLLRSMLVANLAGTMYFANKYSLGADGRLEWNNTKEPKALATKKESNTIGAALGISVGIKLPLNEVGSVNFVVGPEFQFLKTTYKDRSIKAEIFRNFDSPTSWRIAAKFNFCNL